MVYDIEREMMDTTKTLPRRAEFTISSGDVYTVTIHAMSIDNRGQLVLVIEHDDGSLMCTSLDKTLIKEIRFISGVPIGAQRQGIHGKQ
jgi:hypothetical protein